MAKLTCHGGAGSATGANFLFELDGKQVLIDCGMAQGAGAEKHNRRPFPYEPGDIDLLFVTHAHIDHIGLIPKLVREGFRGEIFSTPETKELAELLLADAVKVGLDEEMPLYSLEDVSRTMALWKTLPYHAAADFLTAPAGGGFSVELYDAGHILGSAMVEFRVREKRMLFTGDLGNSPSLLLQDRETVSGLDYLLMESVYGDRNHENRAEREEKFRRIVKESIGRGGALLIPAFSLERAQEILMLLDKLFEKDGLPSAPVYLDSPLALRITPIFEKALGRDRFNFKELAKIARFAESKEIWNTPGPKIIIAGSGMSTAGRILGHEENYLPDQNSTVLFMGYQAAGTLGRQIEEGVKKVIIDGNPVEVRARVEKIDGFSGHADSDALVEFVSHTAETVKKVFVAMGEPKASIHLAQRLRDELGVNASAAQEGEGYYIDM